MPDRPGKPLADAAALIRKQRATAAGVAAQVAKEREDARSSGVPADVPAEPAP